MHGQEEFDTHLDKEEFTDVKTFNCSLALNI